MNFSKRYTSQGGNIIRKIDKRIKVNIKYKPERQGTKVFKYNISWNQLIYYTKEIRKA